MRNRLRHEAAPARERDLAARWLAGLIGPRLTATDGAVVQVVAPGMPGGGPGPDFRHAVLVINGALRFGDVEVHLRSSGWTAHRHDRDAAYDGVALHVVAADDAGAPARRMDGAALTTVVVPLPIEGAEDADPETDGQRGREPCRDAAATAPSLVVKALEAAGTQRLHARAAALAAGMAVAGADAALWEALCAGMGYGGAEDAWRRIADRYPWPVAARLLGPRDGPAVAATARLFLAALGPRPPAGSRVPAAVRAHALAHLAARLAPAGPAMALRTALLIQPGGGAGLLRFLQVGGGIGPDRARELAVNAVLPALLALSGSVNDGALAAAVATTYETLPASSGDRMTRHMEQKFGRELPSLARLRQGMHHLYRGWCVLGACGRCPLADDLLDERSQLSAFGPQAPDADRYSHGPYW
jgi:hypothetical protein